MTRLTAPHDMSQAPASSPRVIDFVAYAQRRRDAQTADAASAEWERRISAAVPPAGLAALKSDTDVLIQTMRALAVTRARLERLSREAAEARRKLEAIKLG